MPHLDLTELVSLLLAFVPEPHRPLATAIVTALVLASSTASLIVAQMPSAWASLPGVRGFVVRALHRLAHMRFRDEPGTLKLPGAGVTDAAAAPISPRSGQSGRADVGLLTALAGLGLVAALAACPRLPERVGCAEGTRACVEGAPHVCDGDGRYHRAGDLACAAVGGVCVSSEGRAWCAPAGDGGAVSDAADAAEGDDR